MTIDNFEKLINPTILKRGRDYYKDGLVGELNGDDHFWTAEVYGSEDYLVEITLDEKGEITKYFCDCPYDGDTCKHVAAVCYAIREETEKRLKTKPAKSNAPTKKNAFENLLEQISLDEYKEFIRSHVKTDKKFKTQFELFFSGKDQRIDVEQKYRDLIKKLVRSKNSDYGYFDYRSSRALSGEIDKMIDRGREMSAGSNFRDAFLLAKAVLTEIIVILPNCDDSGGYLGGTLEDTIELFKTVSKAEIAVLALKQQMFDFLKSELMNKIYFEYGDFGYHLFSVFRDLALQLRRFHDFVEFIDDRCRNLSGKYDDYQKEFFLKEKISFYRETGHELADLLVKQNMDIVEIRESEVDKAIEMKDYREAKRLIAEGIEIAEKKSHPGTVSRWKEVLLRIARLENDMATIRKLTRYFTFDRGFSKDYYRQWRQTYPKTEWKEIVEQLIDELSDGVIARHKKSFWANSRKPPLLNSIAPILIEEEYWDRLLALVKAEPYLDTLLHYHEYLVKRFTEEMLALYLPAFKQFGQNSDKRSEYADLAKKMMRVMKDIPEGKEKILTIARDLIAQNPRRPAMIEELNRVLKG